MARLSRDPGDLIAAATHGHRAALARLISYVEERGPRHDAVVAWAYAGVAPYVVGITGAPGAGKSTLTDALVRARLRETEASFGILCVDPTSPLTGGALLGDRIRMGEHALSDRVYIRSLATRGQVGGISLAVPDAVRVVGASGFAEVIIETVGVGQVEVDVVREADTTVVVLNPGWGDAVQVDKAGLMEMADVFVINKADRDGVAAVRRDLENMLDLAPDGSWRAPIVECVATQGRGLDDLVSALSLHRAAVVDADRGERRRARARRDLRRVVVEVLRQRLDRDLAEAFERLSEDVARGLIDPYVAAHQLFLEP